jgi:CheY-like chemotaxis protein
MEDVNKKKTVLVIDDNETILTMTKGMLEENYNVITVTSGLEALKLLKNGDIPNLILLDMYMPEMSGWNTLIRIGKLCESHNVKIAIYTSSEDPDAMLKTKLLGAAGYINKPISRTKLLEKVAKLVN